MPNYFPNTIRFYETTRSGSGDETVTLVATSPADVEVFTGLAQTNYSDETIGTVSVVIKPNDTYYLSKNGKIQGTLAKVDLYDEDSEDSYYRVTEVRPAISAYTSKVDFIDLVLEKAEAPDASSI